MNKDSIVSLSNEQLLQRSEQLKKSLVWVKAVAMVSVVFVFFQIGYFLASENHSFSKGFLISGFVTSIAFVVVFYEQKDINEEIKKRNL